MAIDPKSKIDRQEEILLEKESRVRRNFIRRVIAEITTPSVYTILRYLDLKQRFKSFFYKSKIYQFENFNHGQNIALLVIWEHEELREDIRSLVQELKKRHYFICIVNTGKIHPSKLESYASTYISRFNYGQDFGSYKEGFYYLQKEGFLKRAPKLLMANDSVFYLKDLIGNTISEFESSTTKVLGATENFEIWHHIQSFFIMFEQKVFNSDIFLKFWRRFKPTNLRTKNIRYGEIRLTKIVKKIVPESQVKAFWSLSFLSNEIKSPTELSKAITLSNRGHLTAWKKLSWQFTTQAFLNERIVAVNDFQKNQELVIANVNKDKRSARTVNSFEGALSLIRSVSEKDFSRQISDDLYWKAKGLFLATAASGSQIHQNGNLLVTLGCPIVKLDLIYRGAFSYEDAEILFGNIRNENDRNNLRELLFRRAFGFDALRGWKRSAFMKSLI